MCLFFVQRGVLQVSIVTLPFLNILGVRPDFMTNPINSSSWKAAEKLLPKAYTKMFVDVQ